MNWVDVALLLALGLSVLLGLWRGLVFEVLSVLGWIVAYFAAPYLAPWLLSVLDAGMGDWLREHQLQAGLPAMVGLLLAFFLILLLWGLGAKLLRALIHASPLSVLDRLAGAGFGALRGVLLCLLLVLVVGMTPAAASSAWRASQLAPVLDQLLVHARPWLPEALRSRLPAPSAAQPDESAGRALPVSSAAA